MGYCEDKQRADLYRPKQLEIVAQVLGRRLLKIADFKQDRHDNADLIVLRGITPSAIALRIRGPQIIENWGIARLGEFTMRAYRYELWTGRGYVYKYQTEVDKVRLGKGSWFHYGHGDRALDIPHWMMLNLDVFRAHEDRVPPFRQIDNGDGTAFNVYRVCEFPPKLTIDLSDSINDYLTYGRLNG